MHGFRGTRGLQLGILVLTLHASSSQALPIGFGVNQGKLEYDEIKTDDFIVYHDRRVPGEAALTLNALTAAKPHLERWLGVRRESALPVIMSAVTDNASFANFLTDAIELQTNGQGGRDLAWHEYTHATMYRAIDNIFGPAGAIIHLPWMPAWFLEGLADAMAVTVGSDAMAGIERYQALSGDWPSFDRLHSLYAKYGFSERGYATSAAFVRYILRQGDPARLPQLLQDFYDYSQPWWWPYTVVPFVNSLPMDRALLNFTGKTGHDLYEAYKRDAKEFWSQHSEDRFLLGEKGKRRAFFAARGMKSNGRVALLPMVADGETREHALVFDPESGWAIGSKPQQRLLDERGGSWRVTGKKTQATIWHDKDGPEYISYLKIKSPKQKGTRTLKRPGIAFGLVASDAALTWIEQEQAETRICSVPLAKVRTKSVSCEHQAKIPASWRYLGQKPMASGQDLTRELWLTHQEERLGGTRYSVSVVDLMTSKLTPDVIVSSARPISVAFAGKETWLLFAERNLRSLRRYDAEGRCVSMLTFKDHLVDAKGLADGSLVVTIYAGSRVYVRRLVRPMEASFPCRPEDPPTSPLLHAMQTQTPDLKAALEGSEIWMQPHPISDENARQLYASAPLDQLAPAATSAEKNSPAKWRGRQVLAFPWIGADDALGPQLGVVSVPLMDHMQNETVRATFLYGFPSNFPYQELSLVSTRWSPTWTLALYRQQTYNGRFRTDDGLASSYLDEKGGRIEADIGFRALGGYVNLGFGQKLAHLKPYLGPQINGHGWLSEQAANVSLLHSVGRFSFAQSLSGRVALDALNRNFDYNQVGAATTLGVALPFLQSRSSLGLEGSRMRGQEMRDLREVYRPLKTFIPGSGGGYNQNSYPLAGEGLGLFAPSFGDTQARAKVNWTMPVIPDVDKMLWIIYAERLDFTAFYNYGGAWRGSEPPQGWDRLIRAHGYNLDLQLENKGVRFNVGLGTGQVVGLDWEAYVTAGFDALF